MSMASRSRGRKSVKKGVGLTLMVVGASGTGRTTFVNTLCETGLLPHTQPPLPESAHLLSPLSITPHEIELEEDGVRIALTIVDTPGFGNAIDNEGQFKEILGYLEEQFNAIMAMESRIRRDPRFRDDRVHALLYFIPPTGHALRELDIELMRRLATRVNIIPIIGRADSLTPSELKAFKKRVMEDIEHYQIPIYNFPTDPEYDDAETVTEANELRASLPFAIVGSEEEIDIDGEPVRVRQYPWGIVEIDNPDHTDFTKLRSCLFNSHLTELKEISHDFLYENYRTEKLSRSNANESFSIAEATSTRSPSTILNPTDLASQSHRLKEDQLRAEEEKLREVELRVAREIAERRLELLAREETLRNLEARLAAHGSQAEF